MSIGNCQEAECSIKEYVDRVGLGIDKQRPSIDADILKIMCKDEKARSNN